MFVAHDVELGVPFVTARSRLMDLIAGHSFAGASRMAYDEGLARIAAPAGGVARLMRVRSLQPAHTTHRVTAGLRWEASGPSAGLFPVLDADLTLAPASHLGCRLALAGVYRAPFGYLNDDLGRAMTGRVADTTVRALLRTVAGHLAGASSPAVSFPRSAGAP